MSKIIMGIQLKDRINESVKFQGLISEYGCHIQTRLGLHEASPETCSRKGLILLEFVDNTEEVVKKFEKDLKEIDNIEVQKMVFKD